eukprot:TRINITY_DN4169_c0_g1_i1.p1 TRINITY_DN4169_c0_g1~~TRINITY_DN4169_c0_g1_i1.p1  ORF type:complete len:394 (+),score=82.64 TRINITY_DN4169_c0_g1_i1:274-1455(+)
MLDGEEALDLSEILSESGSGGAYPITEGGEPVTSDEKTWPEGWKNDPEFWPDWEDNPSGMTDEQREKLPNLEDVFVDKESENKGKKFDDDYGIPEPDPEANAPPRFPRYTVGEHPNPKVKKFHEEQERLTRAKAKNIESHPGRIRDEQMDEECTVFLRGDMVAIRVGPYYEAYGNAWSQLKMEAKMAALAEELQIFSFMKTDTLTDFLVEFEMPLMVTNSKKGAKSFRLEEEKYAHYGIGENWNEVPLTVAVAVDHADNMERPETFRIILTHPEIICKSGVHKSISECLKDIIKKLPPHLKIKSCYTCAWSKYTPLGHSTFGGLGCFKNFPDNPDMFDSNSMRNVHKNWGAKHRDCIENYECPDHVQRTVPQTMPKFGSTPTRKFVHDLKEHK